MNSPLSTTPTIRLMRSSSRAGSAMRPKSQSRMRLPLSVTKGASDDMRSRALAPSTSSDSRVASRPKATTSTGTGVCVPSPSTSLLPSTTIASVARGRDDLLAQQGSAESFDQIERAAFDLVSASIVRSIWRCSLNEVSGMSAAFACAAVRSEVGMPTKRRPCR